MSYIKITNTSDNVNRLKLEKLGFSTKREDESTIGQFGSGIKFAPIAAIRRGMEFVFKGNDSTGSYILEYIVKDEDDIQSIYYKYEDYEKPSSFTVDAGVLSWENDFQIYREVVANAIDETKLNGGSWSIDIVDTIDKEPVDNEFSVYMTATESMLSINENFDKFFSVNREKLYESMDYFCKDSSLYKRIDDQFRVYSKGVLVYSSDNVIESCGDECIGLFDYQFDDIKLNEERTISSQYELNRKITSTLALIDNPTIVEAVIDTMLDLETSNFYELTNIPSYMFCVSRSSSTWVEVMDKKYPNTVLLRDIEASINVKATIKSRGYNFIEIDHDCIWNFLTSVGIKQAIDVFGENFKYDYTMGFEDYPKLAKSIDVLVDIFPEMLRIKNVIGTFEGDEESIGITLHKNPDDSITDKIILIDRYHAKESSMSEIISTVVHEWDHYSTSVSDGNMEGRMFRELADTRIGNLVCSLWKEKTGETL